MKHSIPLVPETMPRSTWWTHDLIGWIYFLRECTGLFISAYWVIFLVFWWKDPGVLFVEEMWFKTVSVVGLVAAVFHSFTWFAVSVKVTPFDLSKTVERAGFVGLVLIWLLSSYGIALFLY